MIPNWLTKVPVAHRGLHNGKDIIENTKSAFQNAIDNGYAIEIDLRLTADNVVIVLHDGDLNRVAAVDMKVAKANYNDIIEHSVTGSDDGVMKFTDFLKLVDGRVPLLIEFKPIKRYKVMCDNALELLRNYKGEFALQSFNPIILNYLRKISDKSIAVGILSPSYCNMPPFVRFALKHFLLLNFLPDFLSQSFQLLDARTTTRMRKKGVPVITWTITTDEEYAMVKGKAVNIIFENIRP